MLPGRKARDDRLTTMEGLESNKISSVLCNRQAAMRDVGW